MALIVNEQVLVLTEQGFLTDSHAWNESVALELARREQLILTPEHWEIIFFIRDYYQRYQHLPNARVFVKAVRASLGDEKGSSCYLQRLFPDGPLMYACKIAGLPKPPTCM